MCVSGLEIHTCMTPETRPCDLGPPNGTQHAWYFASLFPHICYYGGNFGSWQYVGARHQPSLGTNLELIKKPSFRGVIGRIGICSRTACYLRQQHTCQMTSEKTGQGHLGLRTQRNPRQTRGRQKMESITPASAKVS